MYKSARLFHLDIDTNNLRTIGKNSEKLLNVSYRCIHRVAHSHFSFCSLDELDFSIFCYIILFIFELLMELCLFNYSRTILCFF